MSRDRLEHFHFVVARGRFQDRLQAWLDERPRQVRRVMGFGHDLLIRWREPQTPAHRTTHARVYKFYAQDGKKLDIMELNDKDVHVVAEGRNDFLLFVFWRNKLRHSWWRTRIRRWLRRLID
jgi:hypothetical protein